MSADGEQKKILVVDDNLSVLKLCTQILLRQDYVTETVRNGYDAIETFHQDTDSWFAIILDISLPDISGAEVYHRIRESAETPVIFSSGHSEEDVREQVGQCRNCIFLQKPFTPKDVYECLAKLSDKCAP